MHTEMQSKLQDVDKKHQALQVMFDDTLARNPKMLKEKEQQEEMQRAIQLILQDLENKNTFL